jgi:Ser/Thr protein kinase RdoA (MazF antagonist)
MQESKKFSRCGRRARARPISRGADYRFDHAQPGPRLWDVAYAAYRWVPMTAPSNADGFGDTAEQATRLRTFCDRYGLDDAQRAELIDAVAARLHALVDFMHTKDQAIVLSDTA